MADYDVVVIGSGAGGQTVAAACATGGMTVAVVDHRPFGGTCALRGCMPKKVLLAGAEAAERVSMLQGRGVSGECAVDWPSLMAFKRSFTSPTPARMEAWMHGLGIETLHETARFASPDELLVGSQTVTARAIVVATGARPIPLGIPGEELVTTSEQFLDLEALPKRVVFIGGGYISFEFAGLARRAGSEVTIVHRSGDVLKGFDPTLVEMLAQRYHALGIRVLTNAPVERVEEADGRLVVVTPTVQIEADMVVHGAGRAPDLDALDLHAGCVEHTARGVTVDAHLRSVSNDRVWAVGDASDAGLPLTPVAGAQGEVVAANILGRTATFEGRATPSVVFSGPPLAMVGMDAASAEGRDDYSVRFFDMGDWFSQARLGNDTGGAKLVVDVAHDTIVGAHLLGIGADEVINIFTLAVKFGLTVEQLKTVSWTYPTLAYEINYLSGRY